MNTRLRLKAVLDKRKNKFIQFIKYKHKTADAVFRHPIGDLQRCFCKTTLRQ